MIYLIIGSFIWIALAVFGIYQLWNSMFHDWRYFGVIALFAPVIVPVCCIAHILDKMFPDMKTDHLESAWLAFMMILAYSGSIFYGLEGVKDAQAKPQSQNQCVCK